MKNKRPQSLLLKNLKWLSPPLLLACLLFIYFMPRAVVYSDYAVIRWMPMWLIIFILPLLILITLISFTNLTKYKTVLALSSIAIVGPTFGLLQDHGEKEELSKYGVWGKSIVIDRKHKTNKGAGPNEWVIKCKYGANNRGYETLYNDDPENSYRVGDTVQIIFSSQFPKIYAMGYEWKKIVIPSKSKL